jgi:glutathione S-transferase
MDDVSPKEPTMKIYLAMLSTHSRPIAAVLDEAKIGCDRVILDLGKGEARTPEFKAINPNAAVPVLVDDDFVLTEASAILKYVTETHGSQLYPTTSLRARARVNERLDWFNTQFSQNLAEDMIYPQLLPAYARGSDEGTKAAITWGLTRTKVHLAVLDRWLGESAYACGDAITIADFYGASFTALITMAGGDLTAYPNVARWLGAVTSRPSWGPASVAFDGLAAHLAQSGAKLVTVRG